MLLVTTSSKQKSSSGETYTGFNSSEADNSNRLSLSMILQKATIIYSNNDIPRAYT